jgi:hypothetical protein
MIDIQVPMARWTRSQGLNALLEEIRGQEKSTIPLESERSIKGQEKREATYRTRTVASLQDA